MFTLPNLPYPYNVLEPYIDEETMKIHHDKHHKAYMDKLNTALKDHPEILDKNIEEVLSDIENLPKAIQTAVQNNGGGYYHHNLLWEMMSPNAEEKPSGKIVEAINRTFNSFENFKEKFTQKASTHFASGWTWLVKDKTDNLSIISTNNQNSPISIGLKPLIGIDTWEHAYYLKYQNRRPEYIEAWWNIVNWKNAEERFNS